MPIAGGVNSIDVEIREDVSQAIKENERFIQEMDRTKAEFKETQAAMDKAAKASESAAKTSSMSWTDFRSMYQTVLDVVRVGQAVWEEFGQKFVDNAVAVGNMARMMGTTTEEASRLKEVSDDVGISFESVSRELKNAAKDGFTPSIDSLAKMADEYNALAPGVERIQFLLDRFGKSGDEMGKLLEKGGDGIRSMSAAMDESLIVTQEAYEQARKYQVSVDALKDSWDALTYKAAPPLVDAMTNVVNGFNVSSRALEILRENAKNGDNAYMSFGEAADIAAKEIYNSQQALLEASDAANGAGGAFESEAEKAKRLADEAKDAAKAIQEISQANKEYLSMVGKISDDMENYRQKITDLNDEHATLLQTKQDLIAQGYSEEGKTIQDVNAKIDENIEKQRTLADEVEKANRRMILSMLEKQLSINGLNEQETAYLLNKGLEWGVYSQSAVDAAKAAQAEVANLTAALNVVPTEKTITVTTMHNDVYSGSGLVGPENSGVMHGHATGGSFLIPQSYGSEGFKMGNGDTASGGETVTISPPGKSANDMSSVVSAIQGSRIDENRLARAIATALKRGE